MLQVFLKNAIRQILQLMLDRNSNKMCTCGAQLTPPVSLCFLHILFSEGGFTLGTAPAFFVQVWHPGFVDPGPAPTML